ncbi:type IV secretory system conjugative DNA transfer family protein [Minwuia sp.]|uniref:type IV secretory system conjugative DNA transfer family protein n=1 Tax=Minwuia sp. TaxID=2493630 RepID=UPI003A8F6B5D
MAAHSNNSGGRVLPALIVCGLSLAGWRELGFAPALVGGSIDPLPAAALFGLVVSGIALLQIGLRAFADLCGYLKARQPTGRKGKARFAKNLMEVRHDLIDHGTGLYFGAKHGTAIFPKLETVSYILGASGSGKTTKIILPQILGLKGTSKIYYDYKSDITPQVVRALKKRGECVRIINLGGLYPDLIGQESDIYNPLILILECFTSGRLEDVTDLVRGLCLILDPDDKSGDLSNASFWKGNNRRVMGFATLVVTIIEGDNASLGAVRLLLDDKQALLRYALWAGGRLKTKTTNEHGEPVEAEAEFPLWESPWVKADIHDPHDIADFEKFLRALASGIADVLGQSDGKLADSILSGARESALSYFDITTRAHKVTSGKSTFRFSDTKERGTTTIIAIMLDPNKKAQQAVLGVLNWAALMELRAHENKQKKVYLLVDEAGNLPWVNMTEDLTTLRFSNTIPVFAFQNFPAFSDRHGKAALETLLSEAQAALFLPGGQRNPETLSMIRRILGNKSVIARSNNANAASGAFSMDGYSLSEEGVPLMDEEEIRTAKRGILLLGNNKPLEVDVPSVAEMMSFKRQLERSPHYEKPYRKRTKLRVRPYPRSFRSWLGALLRGGDTS